MCLTAKQSSAQFSNFETDSLRDFFNNTLRPEILLPHICAVSDRPNIYRGKGLGAGRLAGPSGISVAGFSGLNPFKLFPRLLVARFPRSFSVIRILEEPVQRTGILGRPPAGCRVAPTFELQRILARQPQN